MHDYFATWSKYFVTWDKFISCFGVFAGKRAANMHDEVSMKRAIEWYEKNNEKAYKDLNTAQLPQLKKVILHATKKHQK